MGIKRAATTPVRGYRIRCCVSLFASCRSVLSCRRVRSVVFCEGVEMLNNGVCDGAVRRRLPVTPISPFSPFMCSMSTSVMFPAGPCSPCSPLSPLGPGSPKSPLGPVIPGSPGRRQADGLSTTTKPWMRSYLVVHVSCPNRFILNRSLVGEIPEDPLLNPWENLIRFLLMTVLIQCSGTVTVQTMARNGFQKIRLRQPQD